MIVAIIVGRIAIIMMAIVPTIIATIIADDCDEFLNDGQVDAERSYS